MTLLLQTLPRASPQPLQRNESATTFLRKISAGLPASRDLGNSAEVMHIQELADQCLASKFDLGDLTETCYSSPRSWPANLIVALKCAESKKALQECGPVHVSVVFAMYNEHNRMQKKADHDHGQDFVNAKVAQLSWLFSGASRQTWSMVGCDDGCPEDSAGKMQALVDAEGLADSVQVIRLENYIGHVPFDKTKSTKDSRKGGAVLCGLQHAVKKYSGGSQHVLVYVDADMSADLGQIGLLLHAVLVKGHLAAAGQRYGVAESFLVQEHGADAHPESTFNNSDVVRMAVRHFLRQLLLPPLNGIFDTQCAFKCYLADVLEKIIPECKCFDSAFDMELLTATQQGSSSASMAPVGIVPIIFVEDIEHSTMSSTEEAAMKNFCSQMKSIVKLHQRFVTEKLIEPVRGEAEAALKLFENIEIDAYTAMIGAITSKYGTKILLDHPFELTELNGMVQAGKT